MKKGCLQVFAAGLLVVLFSKDAACEHVHQPLDWIRPSVSDAGQEQAVRDLINRLIPHRAAEFDIHVDSSIAPLDGYKDTFKLESVGNKMSVTGSSGVAAAMGFYYYMSEFCGCHISWAGDQLNLPTTLPHIADALTIVANDRFRYYQNVCTTSYSFVWWDWQRWEREIDWMAMNGINLVLTFNGMEAIWQRVYKTLGLTQDEIDNYLPGPAFLAWQRMGNMHGWGGPMSDEWHNGQVALQHKILDRMRSLGITPILPSFAGHVPDALKRIYPSANLTHLSDWGHFETKYCCNYLLDFTDSLFQKIGSLFLTELIKEFGTDHVYSADTFNEMDPSSSDLSYIAKAGAQVFEVMSAVDSQAIWVMQAWLFHSAFWNHDRAKALLTSVPQGRMIVLDLNAELQPLYSQMESFFGQPFIWCMLHNYGGTVAMFGQITSVNEGPSKARKWANSTMVGTGLSMEGINQNYVMYHFMNEHSWRQQPTDLTAWFSNYTLRRYGKASAAANSAWLLLKATVYNCTVSVRDHSTDVIAVRRPSFRHRLKPPVWYSPQQFLKAWDFMIKASDDLKGSKLFRYDLVDVTREALQLISTAFYSGMIDSFHVHDYDAMKSNATELIRLLHNMEDVLATNDQFLLGRWLQSAKAQATTSSDRKLFEYNARNQITLWGPSGNILDYANKEWSGLVESYYLPRWSLFVYELEIAFMEGRKFDQDQFDNDVFRLVEEPFTFDTTIYPTSETGDSITMAQAVHQYYRQSGVPYMDLLEQFYRDMLHNSISNEGDMSKSYLW